MIIHNYDCLIVGGGLSAHLAASEIVKSGGRVALLSDGSGASPYIHGVNIPLHEKDSPALFLADTLEGGYHQSNRALAKALCYGALGAKETIESLDLSFNRAKDGSVELLQPLGASVPRVVSVGNALGAHAVKKLKDRLAGKVDFVRGRAVRAVCEGGVFGVLCFEDGQPVVYTARALLLATGGFGRLWGFNTNSPDIGGDGIAIAESLGAPLVDMEFVQFEPSVAVSPAALKGKSVITTMFYEGAVLKNALGERFMLRYSEKGERVQKDILAKAISEEIASGRGTPNGGVWYDCTALGKDLLEESYSAYYQRYLACGIDISKEPIEIAAGAHTTLGGVEIDEKCRTAVDGLFACGEIVGGVHGANRLGGNAGLETLVFGKIAGESVRKYLEENPPRDSRGAAERAAALLSGKRCERADVAPLKEKLGKIMTGHLGVIRSGESCARALEEIEALRAELPDSEDEAVLRLQNDLTTARAVALACGERRGSVGCHFRTDGIDEKEKYFIRVQKGAVRRISHE